jgi:hypothetical protein
MDLAELANFFRALGDRVLETKSCFWYGPQRFLFKSLPVHQIVNPSPGELASVLMRGPALALRYPSPPERVQPDGGMYICSGRDYDFHSLSANARSHTRRGLARCAIERIGFDRLARDGFGLIEDTTLRQTGGRPPTTPAQWGRFCAIAARTPDVEAWGAIAEDKLAAFIVGMLIGDCFYLHLQKSSSALLKHYPNNALMFELTRMKLAAGAAQVSHGQIALAASAGLDTFKRSMGFEVQPFKEGSCSTRCSSERCGWDEGSRGGWGGDTRKTFFCAGSRSRSISQAGIDSRRGIRQPCGRPKRGNTFQSRPRCRR